MDLRDVLADAYVFAAQPVLVAGDSVGRTVRWVHASEQLDIAPLLRGGELILSEAANLRSAPREAQTAYLDSLADAGVAALALETTDAFPRIPAAFLAHAEELGFPIIELRRRVPFVQISESINSQLADSSLRRLQIADRMSMALSASVQELVGIDAILAVLSDQTRSSVTLTSLSGELLGSTGDDTPPSSGASAFSAPVSFGGTVVATLTLHPAEDADIHLLSAALERAPEILAIALLHSRPISAEDRAKSRFFSLLGATSAAPAARAGGNAPESELAAMAQQLGFGPTDSYLSLVATLEFSGAADIAPFHELLSEKAPHVISQLSGSEYVAILGFESPVAVEAARADLIAGLDEFAADRPRFRLCVGTGSRDIGGVSRCLASARDTLRFAGTADAVLDARHFALARLWRELGENDAAARYIDDQIGTLLRRDAEAPGELYETLAAYVTSWGSKTDAARDLNIQRQTFYQRLEKIFTLIGPLPAGSPRIPAILTAVFLEQGRRQSTASAEQDRPA